MRRQTLWRMSTISWKIKGTVLKPCQLEPPSTNLLLWRTQTHDKLLWIFHSENIIIRTVIIAFHAVIQHHHELHIDSCIIYYSRSHMHTLLLLYTILWRHLNHDWGLYKANNRQPPRRIQPQKRGQWPLSKSVLSSEVRLYNIIGRATRFNFSCSTFQSRAMATFCTRYV